MAVPALAFRSLDDGGTHKTGKSPPKSPYIVEGIMALSLAGSSIRASRAFGMYKPEAGTSARLLISGITLWVGHLWKQSSSASSALSLLSLFRVSDLP